MKTTFIFPDGSEKEVDSSELTFSPKKPNQSGLLSATDWFVHHNGEMFNILGAIGTASTEGGHHTTYKVEPAPFFYAAKTNERKIRMEEQGLALKTDEAPKPQHKKWEYRVETLQGNRDGKSVIEQVNEIGNDGWELCSVEVVSGITSYYYFKRPIL